MLYWLSLFTFSFSALAYQTNLNGGNAVHWSNKNVSISINTNSQTLSPATSRQIILNSMAEWNQSSSANLQENGGSSNSISFSTDFSIYGPAVVGVTELSFTDSGNIQRANILLNEQNYQFTSTPGFQSFNNVYLGDVVTHEMGHLFGLSHSEVLNSTMFYSTFPGQSSLAADDKAGIRNKYDISYGKISGFVKGGNHIGVLGTHVQAISLKTGDAIGGISLEDGYFEIGGLNLNDSYYLYTAPLKKLDSLPQYFSNVQNSFCPANYTGSFFSACGTDFEGIPQRIHLSSNNSQVDVGVITINCSLRAHSDYNYEKVQSTFQAVTILDSIHDTQTEKAYVGYFRGDQVLTSAFSTADKLTIDLTNFSELSGSKFLKVSLISQAFGSPIEYAMDVKRSGVSQTGGALTKSTNPEGSYKIDLFATIPLSTTASANIYNLEIQAKKLASQDLAYAIPSAFLFANTQNFPYLVVVSVWDQNGPLHDTDVTLSDNASCLDAPFTYAVAKSTNSQEASTSSNAAATAAVAGCGTIEPPDDGSGPSSSLFLMSLGFLAVLITSKSLKSRKKFLS
jgi:predicted Zn-dependent protease